MLSNPYQGKKLQGRPNRFSVRLGRDYRLVYSVYAMSAWLTSSTSATAKKPTVGYATSEDSHQPTGSIKRYVPA